jgi:Fe-S oxidoreductase
MATAVGVRKVAEIERVIGLSSPEAIHYVASANPGCLSFLSASGINIEMVHPVTLLAQSLASQYSKGDIQ